MLRRQAEAEGDALKRVFFDREPSNAITAEKVRAKRAEYEAHDFLSSEEVDADVHAYTLQELLNHPACPSSMRAVIEAALE